MEKPLQLPARIGKYELQEFLGGGMSHVYKARDTLIGGTVVLKILTAAATADSDARARFLREARMARNVAHENIITIYDFGEEHGRPYMVMEFLKGEDLRTAITENHTGELPQKIRIAIQIARAMEFIHAQGIVHRDIKPDNIHVAPDGKIKLMDFGIAKTEDLSITRAGYTLGTPYYMPPEQVMGQKVTGQADVYAFGILLFELLTGVKPIKADTVERIFYEILRKPLDLSPLRLLGIPQPVCELVTRCTAKNPAERIAGFTAVREELERILSSVDVPARQPGAAQLVSRAAGVARAAVVRYRKLLAIAVAGGALIFLLAWVLFHPRPTPAPAPKPLAPSIATTTGSMLLVPAGSFGFGRDKIPVTLPDFYIDEKEVSYGVYSAFCRATNRSLPPGSEGRLNYPAADVSFNDAQEFSRWAGKRLPTAREWEKAARGTAGLAYPWGDELDRERANVQDHPSLMVHSAMPVDSFRNGASSYGALNMTGNVAEFVNERVTPAPDQLARFRGLRPPVTAQEPWYSIRGGAWTDKLAAIPAWTSVPVPARWHAPSAGFRCAKDPE